MRKEEVSPPPFGKRAKTTEDNTYCMVAAIYSHLMYLADPLKKELADKALLMGKYVDRVKGILAEKEKDFTYPLTFEQLTGLLQGAATGSYLREVILNLDKFDFERRKELVQLLTSLLKIAVPDPNPLVEYLLQFKGPYLEYLFANYSGSAKAKDFTYCAGTMLRAFLEKEKLHRTLLSMDILSKLGALITDATFHVASDAVDSFTGVLTYKRAPTDFLAQDYVKENYNKIQELLLKMSNHHNFFAKREALKLLNTLLRDTHLQVFLDYFLQSVDNLKLIMTLLLDQTKAIQFESFGLMQLFVRFHNKYPPITAILKKNQEQLIEFFMVFQNEREEMEFQKDKKMLISQLKSLEQQHIPLELFLIIFKKSNKLSKFGALDGKNQDGEEVLDEEEEDEGEEEDENQEEEEDRDEDSEDFIPGGEDEGDDGENDDEEQPDSEENEEEEIAPPAKKSKRQP